MLFAGEREIEVFLTELGGEYHKNVLTKNSGWNTIKAALNESTVKIELDFLMLSVDEEEQRKLKNTCEACVAAHKPYNLKDILLTQLPFFNLSESTLFEVAKMNNPQAVILILRECLHPSNPLRVGLEGLHSRQTFASALYDRLQPYTQSELLSSLMGQLRA